MLDREHKSHHKVLDVAHQGHQADINRTHQKEQAFAKGGEVKQSAKKPKKGEE
jgi:hypothetical protein